MNEDGEYKCKVCDGSGRVIITTIEYCITTRVPMYNDTVCYCKICCGQGKLDWISNIKKDKIYTVYSVDDNSPIKTCYPSKLVYKVRPLNKNDTFITLHTYRNILGV